MSLSIWKDHTSNMITHPVWLSYTSGLKKTLAISYVKNCLKFICSYLHSIIRLHGHCPSHSETILKSIWNHTGAKIIPSELKMPKRGTLLTDFEMGKITGLQEDGKSFTEIADALGRSYNCIGNFLKQKRPYTHGGGHQEKLNERTKRKILEHYLWEIHHLSGNLSHNWNSKSPKKL